MTRSTPKSTSSGRRRSRYVSPASLASTRTLSSNRASFGLVISRNTWEASRHGLASRICGNGSASPRWQNGSAIVNLAERLGFASWGRADDDSAQTTDAKEEKAEKLDRAADELIKRLDIWQDSYIIFVSATSRDPVKAQRLASSIANDYLASQREARQEALEHVAAWLKGRIDNLQSRVSETEASIEELTAKSGIHDAESDKVREQQIRDLSTQLMTAREEVSDKNAHLEQARHVIGTHGDIDSIPELTASPALTELRRKKMELNWSLADLQNKLGRA